MYANFLIDENLKTVCNGYLDTVTSYVADVKTINDSINKLLEDEKWEGDAHDKCVGAVQVMEEYRVDLQSICSDMKQYIDEVVKEANSFIDNSDKIASIKKV